MISQEYIKGLIEKTDIVEIVQDEIRLVKANGHFYGVCPFHKSKDRGSNSLCVTPTKAIFHCFGCGAHGSVIQFCMLSRGWGFVETVALLAERAKLPPPVMLPNKAEREAQRAETSAVFERALIYYWAELRQSSAAIALLKSAGISGRTAARFRLGYAPDSWHDLKRPFAQEYGEIGPQVRLVIKKDDS